MLFWLTLRCRSERATRPARAGDGRRFHFCRKSLTSGSRTDAPSSELKRSAPPIRRPEFERMERHWSDGVCTNRRSFPRFGGPMCTAAPMTSAERVVSGVVNAASAWELTFLCGSEDSHPIDTGFVKIANRAQVGVRRVVDREALNRVQGESTESMQRSPPLTVGACEETIERGRSGARGRCPAVAVHGAERASDGLPPPSRSRMMAE